MHQNGIGLLSISPFHPCLDKSKRNICSLEFILFKSNKEVEKKIEKRLEKISTSAAEYQVSGKSKKGNIFLVETHPVCKIVCDDDSEYLIQTGFRGNLFEINLSLEKNPELLYQRDAYLLIMMPKKFEIDNIKSSSLDHIQYLSTIFDSNSVKS